jgi:hypothetical protein
LRSVSVGSENLIQFCESRLGPDDQSS